MEQVTLMAWRPGTGKFLVKRENGAFTYVILDGPGQMELIDSPPEARWTYDAATQKYGYDPVAEQSVSLDAASFEALEKTLA